MTLPAIDDGVVVAELWVSLRSLILTYVAGHDIGLPVGTVMGHLADDELTIETDDKKLLIEYKAGIGAWTLYEIGEASVLAKGSFRIGTDSMVAFGDRKGKLELEVAAEAFTARIFDEN